MKYLAKILLVLLLTSCYFGKINFKYLGNIYTLYHDNGELKISTNNYTGDYICIVTYETCTKIFLPTYKDIYVYTFIFKPTNPQSAPCNGAGFTQTFQLNQLYYEDAIKGVISTVNENKDNEVTCAITNRKLNQNVKT
jgi:hypothetical protein